MAHNLCKWIGQETAAMAYTGEVPWHKLGTAVAGLMTAEQALKAADLDKEVKKYPMFAQVAGGLEPGDNGISVEQDPAYVEVSNRFCTMYDGQHVPLGVVSDEYKILQNRDAFGFFDPIIANGEAAYETAGALGNGERVWILAKLPEDVVIDGESKISPYLLFVNSHDGGSCLHARLTPVRVVCQNTMNTALAGNTMKSITIRHSGDMTGKLAEACSIMKLSRTSLLESKEAFCRMLDKRVDEQVLAEYAASLFKVPENEEQITSSMRKRVQTFFGCYARENSRALAGSNTVYAMYNAATDFADHVVTRKSTDSANRMSRAMLGTGYDFKVRAHDLALELISN